mgnify:CR=1 FL=1
MIKKNDLILIGVILCICLAAFAIMLLSRKEGSKLIVYLNGEVYKSFPLDEDIEFTVNQEDGSYNTFVIKDGEVDMIDASCPDKLCVKDRSIHYNNETIVCLPNKLVLEIANGVEDDIDMIAR